MSLEKIRAKKNKDNRVKGSFILNIDTNDLNTSEVSSARILGEGNKLRLL